MKEPKKVIHIGPASERQRMILETKASITVAGGAAGSGKSHIAMLFPLRFVFDDPYFRGVIIRQTTGELQDLWDRACELYPTLFPKDKNGKTVLKINQQKMSIRFPKGGVLFFSYLEHEKDKFKYQGKEFTFVLFDEATHFTLTQVLYLYGRLRSSRSVNKPQLLLTCNPDPESFLLDWVKWYLDEEGTPNRDLDGTVRYFVSDPDLGFVWANTKEELEDIYGDDPDDNGITDFTFISANCYDNPVLLAADPGYPNRLKANTPVDVKRLLYGNWLARASNDSYIKREWFIESDREPAHTEIVRTVRSFDFASSKVSDSNPSPDYTSTCKMSKLKNGDYFIHEIRRTRIRYGEWLQWIAEVSVNDRPGTDLVLPIDPNSAAQFASGMMAKELSAQGFMVRRLKTRGSKLDRARPVISLIMNGGMHILKDCGYDEENGIDNNLNFFYKECEVFDGGKRKGESYHDDDVDSMADAFAVLCQQTILPKMGNTLSNQDFSISNPFNN